MRAASAAPDIRFSEAPGRLPRGRRVYAIGDVHGCAARLAGLHRMIAADLARRPVAAPLLLHIGDYIDKGEDSVGVVRLLLPRDPIPGLRTVNLLGNHERMLRQVLAGDRAARADWLFCGGRETLASYGLDPDAPSEDWAVALPPAHRAFLENGRLALHHREGDYLFVHAGVRPGVPLEEQSEDDLLGIRHYFLQSEADHGAVVVHGHTARDAPQVRANRIGLDTAAWSGGPLSCAVLEGDRLGFLFA